MFWRDIHVQIQVKQTEVWRDLFKHIFREWNIINIVWNFKKSDLVAIDVGRTAYQRDPVLSGERNIPVLKATIWNSDARIHKSICTIRPRGQALV